ncbi:MAG: hypothetical protein WBB82_05530 [Limnothrix sp.]
MGRFRKTLPTSFFSLTLSSLAVFSTTLVSVAQDSSLSVCQSPAANEFLVMIFTPSQSLQEEVRLQVGRTLSKNHNLLVCQHGGNVLSRVGGFESLQKARDWAEYFDGAVGLPSMVITPVTGAAIAQNTTANPADIPDLVVPTEMAIADNLSTTSKPEREIPVATLMETTEEIEPIAFTPQALTGGGYGILVDYKANPQIVTQLKTLIQKEVGLVAYAARGYLLVEQTADSARVTALLNQLTQTGLVAIAVPTEQLILLKAAVTP